MRCSKRLPFKHSIFQVLKFFLFTFPSNINSPEAKRKHVKMYGVDINAMRARMVGEKSIFPWLLLFQEREQVVKGKTNNGWKIPPVRPIVPPAVRQLQFINHSPTHKKGGIEKGLYCTVQLFSVLYCTILFCTVLYCILLYCTVLYCTVFYCTVL